MKKIHLQDYRKWAVTLVAAVMLLFLYSVIFSFSDQNAEQSGSLSYMISEKCVVFLDALTAKNWTAAFQQELALYLEHPIRKLAHFAEYAFMALLVYIMWRPWMERGRRFYFLVIIWVFLSAAGDEFHQLFVPGRAGSFADVLLDTGGGVFGIVCCVLVEKICTHMRKKRCK
uniref:VanZ family protein n=1 Tax=Acetatifactor sp. TaxID=1872090 RepID=UPI004055EF26